jgi:hypothetical protein
VAELHVIAARYAEWEIAGSAEITWPGTGAMFNPWRT